MAVAFLDSVLEVAFVIGAIAELLNPLAVRLISLPTSRVLVVLIGIQVISFSLCFSILKFALVVAPVIEDVPTFDSCLAGEEISLIVRSIFEEEFSLAVELVLLPLSVVVPLWGL